MLAWVRWHRRVIHKLNRILDQQETMMSALDDLTSEVTLSVASIEAAIAALGSSGDATQLAALTAQLATARAALDAAVAARSS